MESEELAEERKLMMKMAEDLLIEMRKITVPINAIMNRLIVLGDMALPEIADGHESARGTIARKVSYKRLAAPHEANKVTTIDTEGNVETVSGRKCGICGQAGHNARTCSNGRKLKKE